MKTYKCSCGMLKPYRRAYACFKCWSALSGGIKAALKKAQKSLRLI